MKKFVNIKINREIAQEMMEHYNDLINLGLSSSENGKKEVRKIIRAIKIALNDEK